MKQAYIIICAIFSMFVSTMDKSEAQSILFPPEAFQVSNGLVTASASSQSSSNFGSAIVSSDSNSFVARSPASQSTSNSFVTRFPASQSTSNSFVPRSPASQSTSNSFVARSPASQSTRNSFVARSPTSQSAGKGFGTGTTTSQAVATVDYPQQQPVITDIPDPSIELFSYYLLQGFLSLDILKPYSIFLLYKPHDLFRLVSNHVLFKTAIDYPYLAEIVARSGDAVSFVSSTLFFNTLSHVLAKFLYSKGLLTIYNAFSLSQTVLSLVQNEAESNGVFNVESMMNDVADGLYDFVNSYGLVNRENLSQIFHLFVEELEELATGAAI